MKPPDQRFPRQNFKSSTLTGGPDTPPSLARNHHLLTPFHFHPAPPQLNGAPPHAREALARTCPSCSSTPPRPNAVLPFPTHHHRAPARLKAASCRSACASTGTTLRRHRTTPPPTPSRAPACSLQQRAVPLCLVSAAIDRVWALRAHPYHLCPAPTSSLFMVARVFLVVPS